MENTELQAIIYHLAGRIETLEQERLDRDEREELTRRRELFIAVFVRSYDKAAAYMTLVISAGYVGSFTVWGWIDNFLTTTERLSTALLLISSLLIFVTWQIYVMRRSALNHLAYGRLISIPDADFDAVQKQLAASELRDNVRIAKILPYVFGATIAPAAVAGGWLAIACVRQLITGESSEPTPGSFFI